MIPIPIDPTSTLDNGGPTNTPWVIRTKPPFPTRGARTSTPSPTPIPTCTSWSLTSDFRIAPNQENPNRDLCNNPGVWGFLGSTGLIRNPANYYLMPNFTSSGAGVPGLNMWSGNNQGHISFNASGSTYVQGAITWPVNTIDVHPGPAQMVVMAWHSPINGYVSVAGRVSDNNPYTGNCNNQDGIQWFIDKNTTNVASGGYANGGSQTFASGTNGTNLNTLSVVSGDVIYLAIHPGGNYYCDDTFVDLVINTTSAPTVTPTPTRTFSPTSTATITPTNTPVPSWYTGNRKTGVYGVKANISAPSQAPYIASLGQSNWVSLPANNWVQAGWRYYLGSEMPIPYIESCITNITRCDGGYQIRQYDEAPQNWGTAVLYQVTWFGANTWCGTVADKTPVCRFGVRSAPNQVLAFSEIHSSSSNALDTNFIDVSYLDSNGNWFLFDQPFWLENYPYRIDKTQNYLFHTHGPFP